MGVSDLLDTAVRRDFVLRMRKAGATYREIASAAIAEFGLEQLPSGWDCRYAYMDVKRELEKLRNIIGEEAEDIRQIELERLNDMLRAVWNQATGQEPDYGAVDRVLRIMKRRAELLGLDAPQKREYSGDMVTQLVWPDELAYPEDD